MLHAGMLTAAGLVMLLWRPCRSREGRAPAAAIFLLMSSAAAVWIGLFGLAVAVAAGMAGDAWTACGVLWRQLLGGDLAWWRMAPLLCWAVLFPLRSSVAAARQLRAGQRVRRSLVAAGEDLAVSSGRTDVLVVGGLATPAVTLGVLRAAVLVDADFWAQATALQRDVVLTHELAHVRGRHAVIEAVTAMLVAPLSPLPAAEDVYQCVRRHLEALADDVAARRHGRRVVGTAVGRIALAGAPTAGLGVAGECVWRVQRLIDPSARRSWNDRAVLVAMVLMMVVGIALAGADTAAALGPVRNADFCPVNIA